MIREEWLMHLCRFYDDEACMKFVMWEFPEYLEAYRSLENNIERSDFFRRVQCLLWWLCLPTTDINVCVSFPWTYATSLLVAGAI